MFVLLGGVGLYVLMGLLTNRFGAFQRFAGLAIAVGMAMLYLFVRSTY